MCLKELLVPLLASALIVGCASDRDREASQRRKIMIADCIKTEAKRIAPKPVDLETAATAAIAACAQPIDSERLALIASFPGYRQEVDAAWADVESSLFEGAREEIALDRTK